MEHPANLAPSSVERRAGAASVPRRRWDDGAALQAATPTATLPATQVALTVKQVAELLGMTPKAVYHRAERGQIPGKFYVGNSLRFRRADLLRSISRRAWAVADRSR